MNRLKEIRKKLRFSQAEFANRFGIKQSYYSAIERGENKMSGELLSILFTEIGVSPDWYYNGKGDMFNSDNSVEYSDNNVVNEMLIDLNRDPKYKYSKDLSLKMFAKHSADFSQLIDVLEIYWEHISKTMQFINQYDSFILNNITLETYRLAKNENLTKEQLADKLSQIFGNIPKIIPVINALNKCLNDNLAKMKKLDLGNTIERNDWIEALKAIEQKDIAKEVHYESILSIMKKDYPDI